MFWQGRGQFMKAAIVFGVLLALARTWIGFSVTPEAFSWVSAFKDIAHVFAGALWGMGSVATNSFLKWPWSAGQTWHWRLFWALNAVEVAVATLSRV
jgi:hypothetical protein